jgi:hypothetical protein
MAELTRDIQKRDEQSKVFFRSVKPFVDSEGGQIDALIEAGDYPKAYTELQKVHRNIDLLHDTNEPLVEKYLPVARHYVTQRSERLQGVYAHPEALKKKSEREYKYRRIYKNRQNEKELEHHQRQDDARALLDFALGAEAEADAKRARTTGSGRMTVKQLRKAIPYPVPKGVPKHILLAFWQHLNK